MSELYQRVLLWHKLVAQTTGGLALCSAKKALNRGEAVLWVNALRNVSDEIQSVLDGAGFILDQRGQRVSDTGAKGPAPRFYNKEGYDDEVASAQKNGPHTGRQSSPKPAGGLRIAKRKNAN